VRYILNEHSAGLPVGTTNNIEVFDLNGTAIPGLEVTPNKLSGGAMGEDISVQWNGDLLNQPKQYLLKITLGDLVYESKNKFLLVQEHGISLDMSKDFRFEYYGDYVPGSAQITIGGPGSGPNGDGSAYSWKATRVIDENATEPPTTDVLQFGTDKNGLAITTTGKDGETLYTKAVSDNIVHPDGPILYTGDIHINLVRNLDGAVIEQAKIAKPMRAMGKMPYKNLTLYPYKTTDLNSIGLIKEVRSDKITMINYPCPYRFGTWYTVREESLRYKHSGEFAHAEVGWTGNPYDFTNTYHWAQWLNDIYHQGWKNGLSDVHVVLLQGPAAYYTIPMNGYYGTVDPNINLSYALISVGVVSLTQ
jgi:hypothetical protein